MPGGGTVKRTNPAAPAQGSGGSSASGDNSAAKRPRGPLAGLCIALHGSIPSLHRRLHIIQSRLAALGASAAVLATAPLPAAVTHVVIKAPDEEDEQAGTARPSAAAAGAAVTLDRLLQAVQQQQQQQQQQEAASASGEAAAAAVVRPVQLVSDAWLDAVLTAGQRQPERPFSLQHLLEKSRNASRGASMPSETGGQQQLLGRQLPASRPTPDAPLGKFAAWLGRWSADLNTVTSQIELVLQASFAAGRGGNEAVCSALRELTHYEESLGGAKGMPDEPGRGGFGHAFNHQALSYAHAAAVVRGCAFPLSASMTPRQLQQSLPLVGKFTAGIIHQLLATGSCDQLEQFRANQPVKNASGQLREGTAGASSRRLFTRLPGVGAVMARRWWQQGFSSIEQVLAAVDEAEAAAAAAGGSGGGSNASSAAAGAARVTAVRLVEAADTDGEDDEVSLASPAAIWLPAAGLSISRAAAHSLRFAADLLEPITGEENEEMQHEVKAALEAVTGVSTGWRFEVVGGGRRSQASHDADFLIGHAELPLDGLVEKVYHFLVGAGRLVSCQDGFCQLRRGNMIGLKERMRHEFQNGVKDTGKVTKFDHLFGVFITSAAGRRRRRRLDVIFVPNEQWPYAVMGWTGSKQWLRFLRQHAGSDRGMMVGSHFMFRRVSVAGAGAGDAAAASASTAAAAQPGGSQQMVVLSVPDESPPAGRDGGDWWPPGWEPAAAAGGPGGAGRGSTRVVETEQHIFELLGLPYRTPAEREA